MIVVLNFSKVSDQAIVIFREEIHSISMSAFLLFLVQVIHIGGYYFALLRVDGDAGVNSVFGFSQK